MKKLFLTPMFPDAEAPYLGTFVRSHYHSLMGFKLIYPGNNLRKRSKVLFYLRMHFMFIKELEWKSEIIIHYPLYFPLIYVLCFLSSSKILTVIHGGEIMGRPMENKIIKIFKKISKYFHVKFSKNLFVPSQHVKSQYYFDAQHVQVWYSGGIDLVVDGIKKPRIYDFLFVGRIDGVKGIEQIVDFICEIERQQLNKKVCLIGPGFVNYFSKYQYDWLLVFDGLDGKEILSIMRKSKILLVPSLNESLCLVAIEGYCCGCNLVVNDLPALREVFDSYPSILFVEDFRNFVQLALDYKISETDVKYLERFHAKFSRAKSMEVFRKCL